MYFETVDENHLTELLRAKAFMEAAKLLSKELDYNYQKLRECGAVDEYLEEMYEALQIYNLDGEYLPNIQERICYYYKLMRDAIKNYVNNY